MKFYTEFIVMHGNEPMPDEKTFCPSFWKADDFDSDGDFYAVGLDERWTDLKLTKVRDDGPNSILTVNTLRETRHYDPGFETLNLQRYIDYHRAGYYREYPTLLNLSDIAVTSLTIETPDVDDYREFLKTVHAFLGHTGGVVVNPWEMDQASFKAEFLDM